MDLQIIPPTPNNNADENGDTRLISEAGTSKSQGIAAQNQATDGWQLVLSRRQREAAKHNDRLPTSRLTDSHQQAARKETGITARQAPGTNIIIVSTPSLEVADVIRRTTCIELRGKQHPFNIYVADPEDSYKGVVHGFPAHTESADLEQHLRVRTQGVSIERARMLGSSNTALLTFSGGTRPKCVYCMGVEMRCTEYRPTIKMCLECMQEGHRSDVCPNPKNICRGCGLENPTPQGHECEVKCAVCKAAGHETRLCPNAAKRGKTTRQSRSRERSGQNTKKAPGRWFESTEEEDLYRRRSRSRSSPGSRAKSNTPSRDPSSSRASQRSNSPLPKKQQVGRARVVSPTAPKQNTVSDNANLK
ncbi:hypothetical protein HPB49_012718 [Dermacentor silvarum]|uniref:Uncharacterized protein n=1 Tax=Dermacentor silvarum TaxID=543639 RepID=A0ACB8C9F0_DERSI|nr:hypothetical protein HPB49_012718 [Dermacentor silvarum]